MAGSLQTVTDGKNLQNFLICLEMLPAALGMMFAFPYTEYKGQGARKRLPLPARAAFLYGNFAFVQYPRVLRLCAFRQACRPWSCCGQPRGMHIGRQLFCLTGPV